MKLALLLILILAAPIALAIPATIGSDEALAGFSLSASSAQSLNIGKQFTNDGSTMPLSIGTVYGFALSGELNLQTENSLVRVILVNTDGSEKLVLEAYPLLYGQGVTTFKNVCEESCALTSSTPSYLRFELRGAYIELNEAQYVTERPLNPQSILTQQSTQAKFKIKKLNEHIKQQGLRWVAGETGVSDLSYSDKVHLISGTSLPDLQGFEYYKSGIFEFKGGAKEVTAQPQGLLGPKLPESFDWRNRHGRNWLPSIRNQGYCGSCWAFGTLGTAENLINVYYNQPLDITLSVQQLICQKGDGCSGAMPQFAINKLKDEGVVDTDCMPYYADDTICDGMCSDGARWKIKGAHMVLNTDGAIKRALIEHGPLTFTVAFWDYRSMEGYTSELETTVTPDANHAMSLVGYTKDKFNGKTVWIVKNSWGLGWGDEGYGYISLPMIQRWSIYWFDTPYVDKWGYSIKCEDRDHDNYCNWGITKEKPASCPDTCMDEEDCDDSNPHFGKFDDNYECTPIQGSGGPINLPESAHGCCVNPYTTACDISTAKECCPDSPDGYGDADEIGPVTKEECLSKFFYQSDSDSACSEMDTNNFANAGLCMMGCCCSRLPDDPDGSANFAQSQTKHTECIGQSERWFSFYDEPRCSNKHNLFCERQGAGIPAVGELNEATQGCCCTTNEETGFESSLTTSADCQGENQNWILIPKYKQCSYYLCASHDSPNIQSNAPVLEEVEHRNVHAGEKLTIQLVATGAEPITYSAEGMDGNKLPAGSTFDPRKGLFEWTPGDVDEALNIKFVAANEFGYDSRVGHIDVFASTPTGNHIFWGIILGLIGLLIGAILSFFGLASTIAGLLGIASWGLFGLVLSGLGVSLAMGAGGLVLGAFIVSNLI